MGTTLDRPVLEDLPPKYWGEVKPDENIRLTMLWFLRPRLIKEVTKDSLYGVMSRHPREIIPDLIKDGIIIKASKIDILNKIFDREDLVSLCYRYGLKISGNKLQLIERLQSQGDIPEFDTEQTKLDYYILSKGGGQYLTLLDDARHKVDTDPAQLVANTPMHVRTCDICSTELIESRHSEDNFHKLCSECQDFFIEQESQRIRSENNVPSEEVRNARESGNLKRMLLALPLDSNLVDRHYLLLGIAEITYYQRKNPKMADICIQISKLHLKEFSEISHALKRDFNYLPHVPTFEYYATILTERCQFNDAVSVCEAAIKYGLSDCTKSDYVGRIARIRKKQAKANAEDHLRP